LGFAGIILIKYRRKVTSEVTWSITHETALL
jgi:hypothetical protein